MEKSEKKMMRKPFEELMNEILELISLKSQLSLMLRQILSIIQSGLTITQQNTANRVVQIVKS